MKEQWVRTLSSAQEAHLREKANMKSNGSTDDTILLSAQFMIVWFFIIFPGFLCASQHLQNDQLSKKNFWSQSNFSYRLNQQFESLLRIKTSESLLDLLLVGEKKKCYFKTFWNSICFTYSEHLNSTITPLIEGVA